MGGAEVEGIHGRQSDTNGCSERRYRRSPVLHLPLVEQRTVEQNAAQRCLAMPSAYDSKPRINAPRMLEHRSNRETPPDVRFQLFCSMSASRNRQKIEREAKRCEKE